MDSIQDKDHYKLLKRRWRDELSEMLHRPEVIDNAAYTTFNPNYTAFHPSYAVREREHERDEYESRLLFSLEEVPEKYFRLTRKFVEMEDWWGAWYKARHSTADYFFYMSLRGIEYKDGVFCRQTLFELYDIQGNGDWRDMVLIVLRASVGVKYVYHFGRGLWYGVELTDIEREISNFTKWMIANYDQFH
jgi:hypothetical protein